MGTLTGHTPATTYPSLMHIDPNVDGTLRRMTDGLGNPLPILVSSTAVEIDQPLSLTTLDITTLTSGGVNSSLVPSVDNTYSLGSSSKRWAYLYVDHLDFADPIPIDSGGTGSTTAYDARVALLPSMLGSGNHLFQVNTGGTDIAVSVITVDQLVVTLNDQTIAGNKTFTGKTSFATILSSFIPDADNTYDLGSTSKRWRSADVVGIDISGSITGNVNPATSLAFNVGTPTARWNTLYANAVNTNFLGVVGFVQTNLSPYVSGLSLGVTANRWSSAYIDTLTLTNPLTAANGGTGAATAAAHAALMGPTSGSAAAPSFRVPVVADLSDFDTAVRAYRLDQFAAPTADVSMNSHKITNLAVPSASNDAVNKAYADGLVTGLIQKASATVAATSALPACTYANGTAGVGATLTGNSNGALTVDTYAVQAGNFVLVAGQASQLQNGVYLVTQAGDGSHPFILTRHASMDETNEFSGSLVPVEDAGSANANSLWLCTNTGSPVVGTDAITFVQLNKGTDLQSGTGITISGNTVSVTGILSTFYGLSSTAGWLHNNGSGTLTYSTPTQSDVGLSNVENTALSTWAGTTNITTLGTIATGTWAGTAVGVTHGGTGGTSANAGLNNLLPSQTGNSGKTLVTDGTNTSWGVGGGSVTSVGLALPSSEFVISGSPVTGSGTLTGAWQVQLQNYVFAGPSASSFATPGFRLLVSGDIPQTLDHTWITDFDTQVHTSRLDQLAVPTSDVSMNSHKITNVATPTSSGDAVNKSYADALALGSIPKITAQLATAGALPACTYANGTSGVGATLTGNSNGALTVDGTVVQSAWRVLVTSQSSALQNGLYDVTTVGDGSHPFVLTRNASMDQNSEFAGSFIPVEDEGTSQANSIWLCVTTAAPTIGTDPIAFTRLNKATDLAAGTGIGISGNTVSVAGITLTFASLGNSSGWLHNDGSGTLIYSTPTPTNLGLGNVENTALSTWAGTTNITTVGTIATGTWAGTAVGTTHGGTGATSANAGFNALAPSQTGNSGKFLTTDGTNTSWGTVSGGGGSGTVTSVGLALPAEFSVSGTPVISTGTLTGSWANATANQVFSGPTTGSPGTPAFRALVVADIPTLTSAKISDFDTQVRTSTLAQMAAPGADVSMNNHKLTSVADPVSSQDAANKQYVDMAIQGLKQKPTATVATTAALAACTYGNGSAGLGATLTGNSNGALTVDTHAVAVGERVLVKNQVAGEQNGLYTQTQLGDGSHPFILTRDISMDVSTEYSGAFIPVLDVGSVNNNTIWLCDNTSTPTVGTTAITFVQIAAAGSYTASTGITITGSAISLTAPVTPALGGTGTTTVFTSGNMVFAGASGVYTQDANFHYDSTNHYLVVGTTGSAQGILHGTSSAAIPVLFGYTNTTSSGQLIDVYNGGSRRFMFDGYGQLYLNDIQNSGCNATGSLACITCPANAGDKIYLYSNAGSSRWGFGISSWTFNMFMDGGNPGTGKFTWNTSPSSGNCSGNGTSIANLYTIGTFELLLNTDAAKGVSVKNNSASSSGNCFEMKDSSSNVLFAVAAKGNTSLTQLAQTTGAPPTLLTLTGAAHTGMTASTEFINANFNFAQSVQFATGNIALQRCVLFQAPSYAFVGASTITTSATVYIAGAPNQGSSNTTTNPVALMVGNVHTADIGMIIQGAASATGDLLRLWDSSSAILAKFAAAGDFTLSPGVRTTGSPTHFTLTGAAHTSLTASTEASDININLNRTVQFATGALTTQRAVRIQAPTYGFVAASTLTTGVTCDISGAPVAGTNATITNQIALRVAAGVASGVPLVVQGASSQSKDLMQIQDSSGTVINNCDKDGYMFPFAMGFNLAVGVAATTGTNLTCVLQLPCDCKIVDVAAYAKTGPTGADLIFDLLYHATDDASATTIWTTTGNRVKITAGNKTGHSSAFDVSTFAKYGVIVANIFQVGSTIAGKDITLTCWFRGKEAR